MSSHPMGGDNVVDLFVDLTGRPNAHNVAAALVAHYSGTVISGRVKLHEMSKRAIEDLKLPQMPFLVTEKGRLTETAEIVQKVTALSEAAPILQESTPFTQGEVLQWLSFVTTRNFAINDQDSLNTLNDHLALRTFFSSVNVTLADIVVFAAVMHWMSNASLKEQQLHNNLTRWFNHIQHLNGIEGVIINVGQVDLPMGGSKPSPALGDSKRAPPQAAAAGAAAPAAASAAGPAAAAGGEKGAPPGDANDVAALREQRKAEKAAKQAAKAAKKGDGEGAPKPATKPAGGAERPVEDVTRLDIRVGVVTKVWKHPDSDKLFCEEIDIGEEKPRPIGSGLAKHMTTDDLLNQKVLVLANLKQKPLAGYPSHGMVLCATVGDDEKIEFLRPHPDTPIGERVLIEGLSGDADAELTSKKNKDAFMAVKDDLRTSSSGIAMYKDMPFTTSKGQVTVPSAFNAQIS